MSLTKEERDLIVAAPETAAERDHLKAINAEMLETLETILNDNKLMNALAGPRARMILDAIAKTRVES